MFHQNTNIDAQSDTCLQCVNDWDKSSLESIASANKCTQFGSPSKMTLLSSGDLETVANGEGGSKFSNTSFYDGGWE